MILVASALWIADSVNLEQVVYAKTDITAGSKGITAFVIEKGMAG